MSRKKKIASTFHFKGALRTDDTLILDLLCSPIKTLKERDIICDQTMLNNFSAVREDILKHARLAFAEIIDSNSKV